MKIPFPLQLVTFGLFALIVVSVVTAFAAGITIPSAKIGDQSVPVTAENLKPSACAGLQRLTQIISGSGIITGTEGNDLILGSSGADVIDGLGGDDCILGGGGDDQVTGGDGTDICIGGPGTDTFITCEGESQ
jgi:hypothetical protein